MKRKVIIPIICLIFFLPLQCGGGGEDVDNGEGEPVVITLEYTGPTVQAAISQDNAVVMAEEAYGGLNLMALDAEDPDPAVRAGGPPLILALIRVMEWNAGELASADVFEDTTTLKGNCGGTAVVETNYDDPEHFTGTLESNRYCYNGVIWNGVLNFTGATSGNATNLVYDFNNFVVEYHNESYTLSGDATTTVSGDLIYITLDELLVQLPDGKVVMFEDYEISKMISVDYADSSVEGRFHHPDHGWVNVFTPVDFQVYTGDSTPTQGVIEIEGSNSTSARLTVLTSSTYLIEADTDGDGIYDFYSGALSW